MRLLPNYPPFFTGLLGVFRRPAVAAGTVWLLLPALLLLAACNYYRVKEKPADRETVQQLADSKIFIVHQGHETWELRNPRLNGELLDGQKTVLRPEVLPFQSTARRPDQPPTYVKSYPILNIVHLYLVPGGNTLPDGPVRLPLSTITRLDLIEKDTRRTTASYIGGGLGITLGVIAVLAVIIALTKSSCPFVYAYDGQQYRFVGEAYGGAIFAPAERHDYLPAPQLQPVDGNYYLKISNELKEKQHTNLAELLVVQHPAGTQVLLDQRGQVHTLAAPQPPTAACTPGGRDCTDALRAADRHAFLFDEEAPGNAPSGLTMTFTKPAAARHGKLVLHAQNSLWLDYLYGEFIGKFGASYNTWAAQQHDQPAAVNRQWSLDQGIPLRVYVDAGAGWQLAETLPTVGPLAARDLVVPLDFGPNSSRQVRVKLTCGFMFWEVDYAALDCTAAVPVQTENCRLASARTERGHDVRAELAADDAQYLRQLRPGTAVALRYELRQPALAAGTCRTAFLHTKGYYEHIRDFKGLPNLPDLYAFKKPGRFIEFSKEKYR